MNKKQIFATAISVIAISTFQDRAMAADAKSAPGSACQVVTNNQSGQVQRTATALVNSSYAASLNVVCPITRDNTTNFNGTKNVRVWINRSAVSNSLSYCTLTSLTKEGRLIRSDFAGTSQVGRLELVLDVNNSTPGGVYGLACTVSPRSSIETYTSTEH